MLRLAPAHVLSDATCVRASSVSSVDVPFYFFFRIQEFFVSADWQKRQTEKARPFAQKSAHCPSVRQAFSPCHLYLSGFGIEYTTRGNG